MILRLILFFLFTAPALAQTPGTSIKDCVECPEMVVLPRGSFVMGSSTGHKREAPPHMVTIIKPFAMARYEVTFDQWKACLAAGGCTRDPDDHKWGKGSRPVFNVTWDDAVQYAKWLSSITGKSYRLPSEAEWEYAARAGSSTDFPWGNNVGDNKVNCRRCGSEWGGRQTAPVGSFPPNAFGLYDMHGNVWEWVQDCWRDDHSQATSSPEAYDRPDCQLRITKGGAWYYIPIQARSPTRTRNDHKLFSYTIGFRVARDLEP